MTFHIELVHNAKLIIFSTLINAKLTIILQDYFPEYSHPLITRIFTVSHTSDVEVTEDQFVGVLDKILAPRSSASLSQIYFEAFCSSGSLDEKGDFFFLNLSILLFN